MRTACTSPPTRPRSSGPGSPPSSRRSWRALRVVPDAGSRSTLDPTTAAAPWCSLGVWALAWVASAPTAPSTCSRSRASPSSCTSCAGWHPTACATWSSRRPSSPTSSNPCSATEAVGDCAFAIPPRPPRGHRRRPRPRGAGLRGAAGAPGRRQRRPAHWARPHAAAGHELVRPRSPKPSSTCAPCPTPRPLAASSPMPRDGSAPSWRSRATLRAMRSTPAPMSSAAQSSKGFPGWCPLETDVLPVVVARGHVVAYREQALWEDVGTPCRPRASVPCPGGGVGPVLRRRGRCRSLAGCSHRRWFGHRAGSAHLFGCRGGRVGRHEGSTRRCRRARRELDGLGPGVDVPDGASLVDDVLT